MSASRLWAAAAVLLATLGVTGWFVVRAVERRQFRSALDLATRDLAGGRPATARTNLKALADRHPSEGEVWYRLGLCEKARGAAAAAQAAWERVEPSSSFAAASVIARARLFLDLGRLADAERLLDSSPARSDDRRETLELLFRIEGRTDDVRALILDSWNGAADPSKVLRRLFLIDHSAFPASYVAEMLARGDGEDDRVLLGRANLAIMSGRLDEAARLLKACRVRRPDDPAVWRARLELGIASGDPALVRDASRHVPASRLDPPAVLRLRAWLAARRDDPESEREALNALVADDPGNTSAWDRLAERSFGLGATDEAARFRRRKVEANALFGRYRALITRDDLGPFTHELARLAEQLGRHVEARGWALIARAEAKTQPLIATSDSRDSLFDRLADLIPKDAPAGSILSVESRSEPRFADKAESARLTFVYDNGHTATRRPPPPEAMGGGVGLLDYDGDGRLDVYAVQGGPFPPVRGASSEGDRLFRNQGDGAFKDVTARAGVGGFARGYGHGVAVGDIDNDGFPDLFITRWRGYSLYHNKGDGTFDDVTERSGLGGERDWPTSAAFADLDGDGDLDLYVCHYLLYDETNPRRCRHPDEPTRHDCNPLDFPPLPDHVFRNDGGRFVDVTGSSGLAERTGRGLGVVAADLDGDNRVDLYVANDMSANFFYRNLGGFRFEEVGLIAGAAASAEGGYKAGMGVACGDFDGDGKIDLAVTNYYGESATYYRNLGQGVFGDRTDAVGLAAPTRLLLGFGIAFLDADNDGRLDLLSANGHVLDGRPRYPFMMPLQLLAGGPGGRLADVSVQAGGPFAARHLGRGLAVGDLDNDGKVDALVVCQNEPLVYLHNQTSVGLGHFLVLGLEGTASNRDGVGATVTVRNGSKRWVAPRFGGGSYQSSADPRLRFGLGSATRVDSVEVLWPSGQTDRHGGLGADAAYLLREGDSVARPLPGWAAHSSSRAENRAAAPAPSSTQSGER